MIQLSQFNSHTTGNAMLSTKFSKNLGDIQLDIELQLQDGITVLRGESGSGKTTIADILTGRKRADSGYAKLNDSVVFDVEAGVDVPVEQRGFGYAYQSHGLFPHLDVEDNLFFGIRFGGRTPAVDPDRLIDLLGIRRLLKRRPSTLSGGESQRVALGRALLAAGRFLVLDEPFASVDARRRQSLVEYLRAASSLTTLPVLYITHSDMETERLAAETLWLADGVLTSSNRSRLGE